MANGKNNLIFIIILIVGAFFLFTRMQQPLAIIEFEQEFGPGVFVDWDSPGLVVNKIVGGRLFYTTSCIPQDNIDSGISSTTQTFTLNGLTTGTFVFPICEEPTPEQGDGISGEILDFTIDPSLLQQGITWSAPGSTNLKFYQKVECLSNADCLQEQDIIRMQKSVCDLDPISTSFRECTNAAPTAAPGSTTETIDTIDSKLRSISPILLILIVGVISFLIFRRIKK